MRKSTDSSASTSSTDSSASTSSASKDSKSSVRKDKAAREHRKAPGQRKGLLKKAAEDRALAAVAAEDDKARAEAEVRAEARAEEEAEARRLAREAELDALRRDLDASDHAWRHFYIATTDLRAGSTSKVAHAACDRESLQTPGLFSTYHEWEVTFQEVVFCEAGQRLPTHEQVKASSKLDVALRFAVVISAYTFGEQRLDLQQLFVVDVNLNDFLYLAQKRYGQVTQLAACHDQVSTMLASWRDHLYNWRSAVFMSVSVHDLVLSAMLFLSGDHQRTISLTDLFQKALRQEVMSGLHRYFAAREPNVAGKYFAGYNAGVKEVVGGHYPDDLCEGAGIRVRKVVEDLKLLYGRVRALPFTIQGIVPAFPDITEDGIRAFFTKRMGCQRVSVGVPCARAIEAMGAALAERVTPGKMPARAEALVLAEGVCSEHGFVGDDKNDFLAGTDTWYDLVDNTISEEEFLSYLGTYKSFFKQEFYPQDKVKPLRGIVSPSVFVRGILWAAIHFPEEVVVRSTFFAERMAKHRTAGEVTAWLLSVFKEEREIAETDFTSMESLVCEHTMQTVEYPIYSAAAREWAAPLRTLYKSMAGESPLITSRFFDCTTPPMRLSGTQQTSTGNAFTNMAWIYAMRFHAIEGRPLRSLEEARDFLSFYFPLCVEGDDGIFAMPDAETVARFEAVAPLYGVRLKLEVAHSPEEAHFCGNRGVVVDGVLHLVRSPLEVLAKITAFFPDGQTLSTGRHDLERQVAKLYSCLSQLPTLPAVSVFCQEVLARAGSVAGRVYAELQEYAQSGRVGLTIQTLVKENRYRAEAFRLEARRMVTRAGQIPGEVRERVAQLFDYPVANQLADEEKIRTQLRAGATCVSGLSLKAGAAAAKVTERVFEGVREKAARFTDEAVESALTSKLSAGAKWMWGQVYTPSVRSTLIAVVFLATCFFFPLTVCLGFLALWLFIWLPFLTFLVTVKALSLGTAVRLSIAGFWVMYLLGAFCPLFIVARVLWGGVGLRVALVHLVHLPVTLPRQLWRAACHRVKRWWATRRGSQEGQEGGEERATAPVLLPAGSEIPCQPTLVAAMPEGRRKLLARLVPPPSC